MENRKGSFIKAIDRVLGGEKLTKEKREALSPLDLFNELEAQCSLRARATATIPARTKGTVQRAVVATCRGLSEDDKRGPSEQKVNARVLLTCSNFRTSCSTAWN